MQTPTQRAIEKAVREGGYDGSWFLYPRNTDGKNVRNQLLLDPHFWQALGRALGWRRFARDEATRSDYPSITMPTYEWEYQGAIQEESWLYHQHRFIDWLAQEKSADEFFEEILK